MQKRLGDNVYNQPGGYEAYIRDRNQVVEDFRKKPKNGVKVSLSTCLQLSSWLQAL